jgi:hypothetical protein
MAKDDQFAVVRVPPPGVARDSVIRDAVMVGNLNAVMEQLPDTTARTRAMMNMYRIADSAVEAEARRDVARADARRARDELHATRIEQIADAITHLSARMDALETRQNRRLKEYIDSLPDPDSPDSDPATHHPSGELHSLGPAENRDPTGFDPNDSADCDDQIPAPKDPTGVSLQRR